MLYRFTTGKQKMDYNIRRILNDTTGATFQIDQEEYKVLCPFHDDVFPSLQVRYDGRYICFSCGAKGGSITEYISNYYNIPQFSFEESCALDYLYPYLLGNESEEGIQFPERQHQEFQVKSQEEIEERYRLNLTAAKEYYAGEFHGDPLANLNYNIYTEGYIYLYSRGFLSDTLKHFHVIDWSRFPTHSIFIPMTFTSEKGTEVWGYQQRRTHDSDWPKYLSMVGMQAKNHVYGYTTPGKICFGLVTEGPLDQWMAWQYGYQMHAQFSVDGSSISDKQAEIIRENCDVVIGGFDMDDAGERAYRSLKAKMRSKPVVRLQLTSQGLSTATRNQFYSGLDAALQPLGYDHMWVIAEF